MKNTIFAVAFGLLCAGPSFAQTAVMTINPEQQTTIREYVVREHARPITMRERMALGATVPADVELMTPPSAWGPTMTPYRYIYTGNQVVFVEPGSRRVVHMIDAANPAGTRTRTDDIKRSGSDK